MKQVPARALLWLTLILLIALSVYGFYSQRLLSQHIWDPQGSEAHLLLVLTPLSRHRVRGKKPVLAHSVVAGFVYAALSVGIVPWLSALTSFLLVLLGRRSYPHSRSAGKVRIHAGPGTRSSRCCRTSVYVWSVGSCPLPGDYSCYCCCSRFLVWQHRSVGIACANGMTRSVSVEVRDTRAGCLMGCRFLALAYC